MDYAHRYDRNIFLDLVEMIGYSWPFVKAQTGQEAGHDEHSAVRP